MKIKFLPLLFLLMIHCGFSAHTTEVTEPSSSPDPDETQESIELDSDEQSNEDAVEEMQQEEAPPVATIEDPHLLGWWRFDEGEGIVAHDSSGNGFEGDMQFFDFDDSSGWVAGVSGMALHFDGFDDYIYIGHFDELEEMDAVTMHAWIKPDIPQTGERHIFGKGGTVPFTYALNMNKEDQDHHASFSTQIPDATAKPSRTFSKHQLEEKWYQVVGTFDGQTQKIYINGVLHDEREQVGKITPNRNNHFCIGDYCGGGVPNQLNFMGLIDEVAIYTRALRATEILALCQAYDPSGDRCEAF